MNRIMTPLKRSAQLRIFKPRVPRRTTTRRDKTKVVRRDMPRTAPEVKSKLLKVKLSKRLGRRQMKDNVSERTPAAMRHMSKKAHAPISFLDNIIVFGDI